jgi:predicted CopG family antitoxin
MKTKPQKMILIDETLHRELSIIKSTKGLKSLSDTIQYLLNNKKL